MERITERNFDMVSRKYETEQARLSGRIEEINASLAEKETSDNGVKDFFSLIAGYADTAELSAATVSKTRYNEGEQNTPKPLLDIASRGKTRYNNIVSHDIVNDNHSGREIPDYEDG